MTSPAAAGVRGMHQEERVDLRGAVKGSKCRPIPVLPDGSGKQCGGCKKMLPVAAFHKDRHHLLGRGYKCKDCKRILYRKYGKTEHIRKSRNAKNERHRLRNPEKDAARKIAKSFYGKTGTGPCGYCGKNKRLEKHHPDYSKPLFVHFICKPCHMSLHAECSPPPEAAQE